jgi:hypothetical protein
MNIYARFAIVATVIVMVLIVGINVLPDSEEGVAEVAHVNPTSAPASSPVGTPPPSPAHPSAPSRPTTPIPPAGRLAIGRHPLILAGTPLSFELATSDWISNGVFGIDKAAGVVADGAGLILWTNEADGLFADPCAGRRAPTVGPTIADLADAVAAVPGTALVSGPSDVTVGGRPAKLVVLSIPADLGCAAEEFYLWYDASKPDVARYATEIGSTIRVWIIDVDGRRIQIDAETYDGAGPGPEQEIQQIIDSIRFE